MSITESNTIIRKSEHVKTLILKPLDSAEDQEMAIDKGVESAEQQESIEKMIFTTESFEMCSVSTDQPLCSYN